MIKTSQDLKHHLGVLAVTFRAALLALKLCLVLHSMLPGRISSGAASPWKGPQHDAQARKNTMLAL